MDQILSVFNYVPELQSELKLDEITEVLVDEWTESMSKSCQSIRDQLVIRRILNRVCHKETFVIDIFHLLSELVFVTEDLVVKVIIKYHLVNSEEH